MERTVHGGSRHYFSVETVAGREAVVVLPPQWLEALGKDMASLQRKLDDTRVVASSIAARRAEGEDPDAGRDALLQKVEYLTELMGTILQHQEEAARQNVPDGPSKSDE